MSNHFILTLLVVTLAFQCCLTGKKKQSEKEKVFSDFWKDTKNKESITELTDKIHDKFTGSGKKFVMYYSPTCPYAKKAREGFVGAAKQVKSSVKFGSVNCKVEKASCGKSDHPVTGYPTFFFYKGGKWIEKYNGKRDNESFVTYLKGK